MPDASELGEWDRISALIEECRAEREACACVREHFGQLGDRSRTIYIAIRERLLAEVIDAHALTSPDDATS